MRMRKTLPLFILSIIFVFACSGPKASGKLIEQSSVKASPQLKIFKAFDDLNLFSLSKFEAWKDSMSSSVKFYSDIKFRLVSDTFYEKNYILYTNDIYYTKRRWHTGLNIYVFKTDYEATDYFNDLKTQEYVSHFGLNKRPNHILVNGNKVYWYKLDHGYGHRLVALKKIFLRTFNFRPHAANLDSVSGFTYCQCHNSDADLSGIRGKWKLFGWKKLYEQPHSYDLEPSMNDLDELSINILSDSLFTLNDTEYKISYRSSMDLPDSYYFMKYGFRDTINLGPYRPYMNQEAFRELESVAHLKIPLKEYTISFKTSDWTSVSFMCFSNGTNYALFNNRLYKLKRK